MPSPTKPTTWREAEIRTFFGRISGKPVKFRHGPAAVIGDWTCDHHW